MALRVFDGFDGYAAAADLPSRWVATGSNGTASFGFGAGRYANSPGQCVRLLGTSNSQALARPALTPHGTWIIGGAFRWISQSGGNLDVFVVRDAGTAQAALRVNTTGSLSVVRGGMNNTGTVLGTSATGLIQLNTWYYLEWKVVIHPTTGSFEVRINGQSVLSAINQNTRTTANGTADEVLLYTTSSSQPAIDLDDVYACDGSGSAQNDFLGECRVQLLRPSAAGDASDFALPAGQSAYAAYRNAVLADSPLHFWELQETSGLTAADTGTGTAQTATFQGTTPRAAGPYSGGAAADTQNGSPALVPYTADLNLTGDMTVEAWVYVPATPTDNVAKYLISRGASAAITYWVGVNNNSTTLTWAQASTNAAFGVALPVGRWVHLAVVRLGASVTPYLDGVAYAPLSFAGITPTSSTHPVWLGIISNGAVSGASNTNWPGRLAYVALYNTALSAARLRNHRAYAPFAALDDQGLAALTADVTYAQSSTVTATSLYQLQDPAANTGTVHGVQVVAAVKKDDAGLRVAAPVVKSGATTTPGVDVYLGVDPRVGTQLLTTDPNTGAAWTVAALQALQAGVRVTG